MKQTFGRWCKNGAAMQALAVCLGRKVPAVTALAGAAFLLGGCSDMVLFNPKGPIGETERFIILTAFALMLLVVVPVIIMTLWFAWRYRASNREHQDYAPKWSYSRTIEISIWVLPAIIVMALTVLIWNNTFRLDPFNAIDSPEKPVNIEAVSLDWKWLFIYPEENIAVVGEMVFPAGVPLSFRLTSDTVMTSFFIPQLGSQIYAMAGMQSRLHLLANEPGTFFGHNQQFSGSGYSRMNFKAIAVSPEDYSAWLDKLREAPETLDLGRYQELAKPTHGYPVTYFSSVEAGLFDHVIHQYGHHGSHGGPHQRKAQPPPRDHRPPEERARATPGEYTLTP